MKIWPSSGTSGGDLKIACYRSSVEGGASMGRVPTREPFAISSTTMVLKVFQSISIKTHDKKCIKKLFLRLTRTFSSCFSAILSFALFRHPCLSVSIRGSKFGRSRRIYVTFLSHPCRGVASCCEPFPRKNILLSLLP